MDLKYIIKYLTNHTEKVVIETMEELLSSEFKNICTCDNCLQDIATYALNRIPASYVSTHHGEVQTRINNFEKQSHADVIAVVTKAIKTVSSDPRH
ncbi:MAG: late competence development ComFB family protein [Halanaerobiaceae bacterium]